MEIKPWTSQILHAQSRGEIRVALVTEFYYPHLGGVTEHVHNLALQLERLGHSVVVITGNMEGQGKDPPRVRRVGVSRVIYSNAALARLTTGRRLLFRMEDIIRGERCELVHVHDIAPTLGIAATLAGSRLRLPVVATLHTWVERSRLYRIFRRPYQAGLDRLAAKIAVSELGKRAYAQYFRTDDWFVIPNGVDTDHFHPDGRAEGMAPRDGCRPGIIAHARAAGYEFRPLSDLLA